MSVLERNWLKSRMTWRNLARSQRCAVPRRVARVQPSCARGPARTDGSGAYCHLTRQPAGGVSGSIPAGLSNESLSLRLPR